MEPEFNSDNDSFLLVLKNLNYRKKATIKSNDKKATIKSDDKKATIKTQVSMNKVLEYMSYDKEYVLSEICEVLGLKETRTKEILKYLINEDKVEALGGNRNRKYKKIQ